MRLRQFSPSVNASLQNYQGHIIHGPFAAPTFLGPAASAEEAKVEPKMDQGRTVPACDVFLSGFRRDRLGWREG